MDNLNKIYELIKSDNCKLALILCESNNLNKIKILIDYYENNKYSIGISNMRVLQIHNININYYNDGNWDYMIKNRSMLVEGVGYNSLFKSIINHIENE
tara:strand:- start:515 stop:811 length:297 start_codon:yes stop_codon:yes gene_type:complete